MERVADQGGSDDALIGSQARGRALDAVGGQVARLQARCVPERPRRRSDDIRCRPLREDQKGEGEYKYTVVHMGPIAAINHYSSKLIV